MAKAIVIVESPTKVKTINKILGAKFKVVSSMGHLIDLPKSTLGVDVEKNFEPNFIVVRSKSKILTQLKKDTAAAKEIYVATDPDREGEAIGWNLVTQIGKGKKIFRVTFQEITKEAVLKAFEHPREFDQKLINAQVARRILDRIVGYKLSPVLWKKVGSRLSAGRVQSVALRILVEREREITRFVPEEYWQIAVDLKKEGYDQPLAASLERIDKEKFKISSQNEANTLVEEIKQQDFNVTLVSEREVKRNPNPPFITSTLQQEAFNKLRFNAERTMRIAQELYEGVELGDGETVGLITYMRTDSVNISQEALLKVREFIKTNYGAKYLPEEPNKYKSRKSAQEAHEAIRPASVLRSPQDIQRFLEPDQYKLYALIWNRFVSCQMTPAVYKYKKIEITAGRFQFGASGSTLVFDGFLTVNSEDREEESALDFSHYTQGDRLSLMEMKPTQHFTKPPARFSDASLVKALEEDGIGRPSTYASIIHTLVFRNYVVRDRGYFTPTELGIKICDLLVEYFAKVMDIGFTAKMEEELDSVEEGVLEYPKLLDEFYQPFKEELDFAEKNIEKTHNFIDKKCPLCQRQMVVKWGRRGKFLSCSGFPACKHAESFTSGVKCPQEGCTGELVERRSKKGQMFYGCSRYPQCTFIANELPKVNS
ncbi:MAG: type I DNA topoisomerase [Candidatus Omnitrophica bacterium]|nr:type I DNA topoisomerase [Candidatus Omnitrophota bacterium]